jgi:ParB/Sulfiredoxin domain
MVHDPRLVSSVQRLRSAEDASTIEFVDDVANVEVPVEILDALPLKNADRSDGPRLRTVLRSIRRAGYDNFEPIRVRIGRRGRWVVHDGGHRLTAARRVAHEVLANLFGRKVRYVRFFLYKTPLSNSRIGEPEDP